MQKTFRLTLALTETGALASHPASSARRNPPSLTTITLFRCDRHPTRPRRWIPLQKAIQRLRRLDMQPLPQHTPSPPAQLHRHQPDLRARPRSARRSRGLVHHQRLRLQRPLRPCRPDLRPRQPPQRPQQRRSLRQAGLHGDPLPKQSGQLRDHVEGAIHLAEVRPDALARRCRTPLVQDHCRNARRGSNRRQQCWCVPPHGQGDAAAPDGIVRNIADYRLLRAGAPCGRLAQ